jgi:hypothetical protein
METLKDLSLALRINRARNRVHTLHVCGRAGGMKRLRTRRRSQPQALGAQYLRPRNWMPGGAPSAFYK